MAVRVLAGLLVVGMSLSSIGPLPSRDSRSHDCDRFSAAMPQASAAYGPLGCDHTDAVCLAMTGCVAVAAAVVPTTAVLPVPPTPRPSDGVGVKRAGDRFTGGPPTPPPNR